MTDCDNCSRPCKSIRKTYFEAGQISFCRVQMFFLIANLEEMREGIYPQQSLETGYTGSNGGSINQSAPFEKACQISGEVDWRLKKTKKDGGTLEHEIRVLKVDEYSQLSPPARNALNYISGWKRRRQPYFKYLKQRKYRDAK